jgi:translocation and assembly module TamB
VQPGGLLPEPSAWPGAISLHAATDGRLAGGLPLARVTVDSLSGSLRGHPLGGSVRARIDSTRIDLDDISLSWGAAGVAANGHVTDDVDLSFLLSTADLGIALPGAGGAVAIEGDLAGPRLAPQATAALRADSLRFDENRLAVLRGDVAVELAADGVHALTLLARGIEAGGQTVDSLAVDLDGSLAEHRLSMGMTGELLRLDLLLTGGMIDSTWQGSLEILDLASAAAGDWSLAAPAAVVASSARAALDSLCLVSADARLCAAGSWQASGKIDANVRIEAVPLTLVEPLLPAGSSITGTLDGALTAAVAADGALDALVDIGVGPGRLTVAVGDTTDSIDFASALHATAGADGGRADLSAEFKRLTGERFGTIAGEAALPEFTSLADTSETQPLAAHATIEIVDLSPIRMLAPDLDRLAGRLLVNIEAGGTSVEPTVQARVELVDGEVDLPDAGLQLRDIQFRLDGNHQRNVELTGSARSGGGQLELQSASTLGSLEERKASLHIEGTRFVVMNTPEVRSLVSPDLQVDVDGRKIEVNGEIAVPVTLIQPKEIPPAAAPVSGDVVLVHVEEEEAPPVDVFADVRVVLGDSVSFQGFGLRTHLGGQLRLIQEPGRPPIGTGELQVRDGTFKAYGQDLTIGSWGDSLSATYEAARIIFPGGPVDNPGLDMRAFREADDGVIAGLLIRGTAKQPELTLFSDPEMPQGDALSYIVLGHRLGEGGGDSDLLRGAATQLGLKGGNYLARSLGSKVGLDEAGIETEGSYEEAAFVSGKYLTPSLYVSHGIGLFDRINTFRVRYLLSPAWTVQAETGKGTGTDVLYRIERGQ